MGPGRCGFDCSNATVGMGSPVWEDGDVRMKPRRKAERGREVAWSSGDKRIGTEGGTKKSK